MDIRELIRNNPDNPTAAIALTLLLEREASIISRRISRELEEELS